MSGPPHRHPWNTEFEWTDHTGPFRRATAEQVAHFDEHGFFVLEDAVPADVLAEVRDESDRYDA